VKPICLPILPELSPTISIALYRIAQEAITNAIKHADASLLKLSLNCREDALHLVVSDNGKGFDLHADESGMGLRTMSHRLRLINGELTVTSQPGNGTRIEARVPLRKL
jgi:protein-histidine pros-kinase